MTWMNLNLDKLNLTSTIIDFMSVSIIAAGLLKNLLGYFYLFVYLFLPYLLRHLHPKLVCYREKSIP